MGLFQQVDVARARERIEPHVETTPAPHSPWLSGLAGADIFLKMESHQPTGSFKLRGAANKLLSLTQKQTTAGVVTASSGNHALGVASMGKRLWIPVDVYVSAGIETTRRERIEAFGVVVHAVPGDCLAAETAARRDAERNGRVYVSPYNDLDVAAGQGAVATELLEQLGRVDAVFVAVGGGGLIGGIGAWLREFSPATQVVGCWPRNSPVMYECLRLGRIAEIAEQPTLSTATAGGLEPDAVTFPLCQQVIDRHLLVEEDAILSALRGLWREHGELAEGAAGVALAGFLQVADEYSGRRVAIVICGGNADDVLAARIRAS